MGMHSFLLLPRLWQLGRKPIVRAMTSGFFLFLAAVSLLNASTDPLGWRIVAEMVAMAAGLYNASLAPAAYAIASVIHLAWA